MDLIKMKIIDKISDSSHRNIKYLQQTIDNVITETGFIEEDSRNIICFSSQLGCIIGCKFCYNGIHKNYYRNLSSEEIVKQCTNVVEDLNLQEKQKPILFSCMGIGEPLLNYDNVIESILELNNIYPNSKFALATTCINPEYIAKIALDLEKIVDFKLTISLHAVNEEIRKKIIPISISLNDVKKYLAEFRNSSHTFEWNYMLLDEINDSESDALEFVKFISLNDNVKITCYNEIDGASLRRSKNQDNFISVLDDNNINYKVFESSGTDIEIGCGQMVTHYNQLQQNKLVKN